MKKVLITGYSGFVGSEVARTLRNESVNLRFLGRVSTDLGDFYDLSSNASDYSAALKGCDVVIHCAARAHIMNDDSEDPFDAYRVVNTQWTLDLAQQAAEAGVLRFVFLSSIKVNGEFSVTPFTELSPVNPEDPYALSKYQAELGLMQIARRTGMEVVIIRSPLVYGPGVKGNFYTLLKLVNKGFPLPLGLVNNKRSLIALQNLVNFIILCSDYKDSAKAANQVFLVSDNDDVSTAGLLRCISVAMNKKMFLIPVPVFLLKCFMKLMGKQDMSDRLFHSLQVDVSKATNLLGWKPVVTMEEELREMFNN